MGNSTGENTHGDAEFKEVFNWWYLVGIVAALVAFPLLHILAWVGRIIFL